MKDELYYAEEGKGAVLNNKPLKVSNKKETFIISTKVDIEGGLREGPIGYIVGLLVKGERDGYIKAFKKNQTPVEGPAVYLFVTEAGGKVTDFYNKPWNVEERNIIVSNGIFHEELLSTLRKSSEK